MKRKYWLAALILAAAGGMYAFIFRAYRFSGWCMIALAALVTVFGLLDRWKERHPRRVKFFRRLIWTGLSLLLAATTATGIWVAMACGGAENPEAEYVIVLGAGVNGTKPSQSLRERLEATKDYLEKYPEAIAILSGGMGPREQITEAQCMYDWLVEGGISPDRLRKEERATTTEENLRFSLDLIEEETGTRPKTTAVVSSAYHLRRAQLLAEKEGLEILGWPAPTRNPVFFVNMFLREICGVWYIWVFG